MELARQQRVCYMCAEAVVWRCHRSIISNNLVVKGWTVHHIMSEKDEILHVNGRYGAVPIVTEKGLLYPSDK